VSEYASAHAVPEPPLEDLRLALTEAMTNAVLHAYHRGEPGTITVSVEIEPGTVRVAVVDDGDGMRPRIDSPGLGLGMPLMSTLADDLDVSASPDGHGTAVRMRFALTA